MRLGLAALGGAEDDLVLIHDAARPFAPPAMIARVVAALKDAEGACPALPVPDTVRRDAGGLAGDLVDRAGLMRAQTPQGFRLGPIRRAHESAQGREFTDDVAVAQAAGLTVALVPGDERAAKLTTPEDFAQAEARLVAMMEYRTGTGFDVHAFADGASVMLCGVEIPFDRTLSGHSDADVGMHALTDAIFGALAEGDIGRWFPPSDPQWRGAASEIFLRKAAERVAARGGRLVNADVTLICEAPKIGPHAAAMQSRLAVHSGRGPLARVGEGNHHRASGFPRTGRGHRGAGRRHRRPARARPSGGHPMIRLATLFGLGKAVPAPGTFGSLAALPAALLLHWIGGFPVFALGLICAIVLGYFATDRYLADTGLKDPGEVIVDEVAGQLLALAPLSLGLWLAGAGADVMLRAWPGWVGGFLLFRLFDILKPPPVSTAERLPGALGVMADDLVAGLMAAIVVTIAAAIAHGWLA